MWILTGVISMAVFVAHVTSVLTSYTLEQDDVTIKGKKVGRQRERSAPPDLARSPLKITKRFQSYDPKIFSFVRAPKSIRFMFSVLQCTNHFCNEFFGFVIPSSIFFWLMCVTVPVFVILLFTCLFFIFLKSFYCLNFWTFNSRTFYSGWYSSADYNTKFLSC